MDPIIEPKVLRGFRDSLPRTELLRKKIRNTLEREFTLFGFVPIDTPALEYSEILLGKGGGETDKQIYRFLDHGKRDIALRFDLTVPFARFMARYSGEIILPFKRYHIAKVWRGENTQRGRYREFTQIDFDIVGVDSASADFEILMVMQRSFTALGVKKFKIHFSHRELLKEFLKNYGLEMNYVSILRIIDKTKKIGKAKVKDLLTELCAASQADDILEFIKIEKNDSLTLNKMADALDPDIEAFRRIDEIFKCIEECGLSEYFSFDPSITRGLDYYTGLVYETFLMDLPEIGSVCSGGRYNNLASLYTREKLPGVGSSIGLDRLISALEELKLSDPVEEGSNLIILFLDDSLLAAYQKMAAQLREAGLSVDVFPQKKKLAVQFNYAEKRTIPLALIYGETEHKKGVVTLKDLRTRKSYENLKLENAINTALELLRS